MSKWMVDCYGQGEGNSTALREALVDLDLARFIEKQGGLASAVQETIAGLGYVVSDRGGGMRGDWHLGVPFDDLDEAVSYLGAITTCFMGAIGCGLLRFALKTWSQKSWQE